MTDPNTIFAALGASAIVVSGFSSYYGMKYGLNGMRERMIRIEENTKAIPEMQKKIAVLEAVLAERRSHRESGEREHL